MKKILVGYATDGNNSGINKYLFNFIEQAITKYDCKVDVVSSNVGKDLKEKLNKYNCKLFEIPSLKHPIKRYKKICNIIKENKYDIVYSNISESFNCCLVKAGKHCKVPRVVVHSHATVSSEEKKLTRIIKTFLNKIFRNVLHSSCNQFIACSHEAGEWLFLKRDLKSNRFHIVNNTIDFKSYFYNEKIRDSIRKQYGIKSDEFVIGSVGNFEYPKNQLFIFQILKELNNTNKKYKFLLVGDGRLKSKYDEYIEKEKLDSNVIFTGIISNVSEVLNAMDLFAFPSIYEGFGIAALEAQANGLPTIISDAVPKTVIVSENAYQLPLDLDVWCKKIKSFSGNKRNKAIFLKNAYQFDNSNIDQFKYIIGDDNNE